MVAQQYPRVGPPPPDVDAHARKGLAGAEAHEQHVADVGLVDVRLREEAGARAGRVEAGELGVGEGFEGFGAGFSGGRWGRDCGDLFPYCSEQSAPEFDHVKQGFAPLRRGLGAPSGGISGGGLL